MRRYKTLRNRKPLERASRGALDARETQERKDIHAARCRAGGRCEVRIGAWRCERPDRDTHHVIKRSQGGKFKGADYLIRVCRECHDLTDAAPTQLTTYRDKTSVYGRLRIAAEGHGRFRCWMEAQARRVGFAKPGAPTNRLSRETLVLNAAPKAPERSEASS